MVRRLALLLVTEVLALSACGDARPAGVADTTGGGYYDAATSADTMPAPAKDSGTTPEDTGPLVITDGYPAGPYGKKEGAVFPPLSLSGYREGASGWTKIDLREYFDPDGKKGIRGLLVVAAAQWCAVCQNEVGWVTTAYTTNYRDKGARFITALLQDGAHRPATQATATLWRDYYSIPYAVAIDPMLDTLPSDTGALSLPYTFVVDPRTMRITKVTSAAQTPPNIPALDAVIAKNG